MGTVRIVEAAFGNQEIIENLSSQNRLGDDSRNILERDSTIPDALGIDYHGRSVLTLIEAARVIGPGKRPESGFPKFELERVLQRLSARRVATSPLVAGFPNVSADENVVREGRHVSSRQTGLRSVVTRLGRIVRRAGSHFLRIASGGIARQSIWRCGIASVHEFGGKPRGVDGPSMRVCAAVILRKLKGETGI